MKRSHGYLFATLAAALIGIPAQAQIVYQQGTPRSWNSLYDFAPVPAAAMPAFDLGAVRAEDMVNDGQPGPWRFAIPSYPDLNTRNAGRWDDLENGDRMWRLELRSPGALTMNVIFDRFHLPQGADLFIYNADRSFVIGPFTHLNNLPWGSLPTTPVDGDAITLEYFEPARVAGQGQLNIGQVNHGYRGLNSSELPFGGSGSCNNNTICPEWTAWKDQIRAVVLLMNNGSSFCSGTLLNNTSKDGRPIISTANHCTGTSVANWSFLFNWDSPTCTPSTNAPRTQTVAGAKLLIKNSGSDFSLVEMSSKPPASYNVYYAGWNASGDNPTSQVCIHHPAGDIKKISLDSDPAKTSGNFWSVVWNDGTTEGGSSGSGLFDQNHRHIGQLLGGGASCTNTTSSDRFGKMAVSWGLGASQYLDPGNTGLKVLDGMYAGGANSLAANFTASNPKSCDGKITFTDLSTNAKSWAWNFGDGGSAMEQSPSHTYAADGNFTVTLTATGDSGKTAVKTLDVGVTLRGTLTVTGASICAGQRATVTAAAPAGTTVRWYNAASGGTSLATGTSYTSPVLQATATYFAEGTFTESGAELCKFARAPAAVTLKPAPGCPVGVLDGPLAGPFAVFPEFNNGKVYVRHYEATRMAVLSLSGETVRRVALAPGVNEVDLTALRDGVYLLRFDAPGLPMRRIVKGR